MNSIETANYINILGTFCGKRDVPELTKRELKNKYGFEQADVMVLFGGSILCGGDVLAAAMKEEIARSYVIVGGEGHTTQTLRQKMQEAYPEIRTEGMPEAKVFEAYLKYRYVMHTDFLECESTNCGNNITCLLDLLEKNRVDCRTMILSQDASMQRRMEAGLKKYAPEIQAVSYAVYEARVVPRGSELVYEKEIWGMWDMERYISLLMGEIPRLSDSADGYGPKGKNYIAHVDIPPEVETAFEELKKEYAGLVREANPLYGGKR